MKSMMMTLLASTAVCVLPAIAQAQSQTTGPQTNQRQQQQLNASRTMSAQDFVRQAAIANLIEIETSQLALKQARSENIRNFAQRMINDHQSALRSLRSAASGLNVPDDLGGEYRNFLSDLRQAGQNFDSEYVDFQIQAHEDTIELFERYADTGAQEPLTLFAEQTLPTLKKHLAMAEDLVASSPAQARMQGNRQQASNEGRQISRDGRTARVLVEQQPPQVTVDQAQPRIIVRQPPPIVTIQQRQPEIIVRMPPPDVNVATTRPEVSVRVPQPRVSINREGRQRVRINRAEQPQVTFERTGSPQLRIREAQGQPQIRYEQDAEMQQRDSRMNQQTDARQPQRNNAMMRDNATTREREQEAQRETTPASERTGSISQRRSQNDAQQTTANSRLWILEAQRLSDEGDTPAAGNYATQRFTVRDLLNTNVYNARGQELGEIDRIVQDSSTNRQFVVLSSGGFLGLFEDEVALPTSRIRYENGRMIVRGLTEQDIEQMPDWDDRVPNSVNLRNAATIAISSAS